MLELGDEHEDGHLEVGEAAGATVDLLIVVGRGAAGIADGREGGRPRPVADPRRRRIASAALDVLAARLRDGDVVLVKASRGIGLDLLVDALRAGARRGRLTR